MKVVSISPYLPFPGVPHAGGDLYRRHALLLAEGHDVVILCPRNVENESALKYSHDEPYRRILVSPRGDRSASRWSPVALLLRAVPLLQALRFYRDLRADNAAMDELSRADLVELQWFEAAVLAPGLRRIVPDTPVAGIFHDVVSQGLRRAVLSRAVPSRQRVLSLLRLCVAAPAERWCLRHLDTAVVLSEKDRVLLAQRSGHTDVAVLDPPLDEPSMPTVPRLEVGGAPSVLFVGAMFRFENDDAAMWLLEEIWPRVLAAVPGARLTLAGAGPSARLRAASDGRDDVELTDYVPDLGPYYRDAQVVVAPLRLGAGVKLKAAVAMLWGLPVVATPVAAEGIGDGSVFAAVDADPAALAAALVRALLQPESLFDRRRQAQEWARRRYSTAVYRERLNDVYGRLGGPRMRDAA